jgi:hypothetical protein
VDNISITPSERDPLSPEIQSHALRTQIPVALDSQSSPQQQGSGEQLKVRGSDGYSFNINFINFLDDQIDNAEKNDGEIKGSYRVTGGDPKRYTA